MLPNMQERPDEIAMLTSPAEISCRGFHGNILPEIVTKSDSWAVAAGITISRVDRARMELGGAPRRLQRHEMVGAGRSAIGECRYFPAKIIVAKWIGSATCKADTCR